VNTAEWLAAVDAHPETIDTDLVVAVAIANGSTTVDGWDQQTVDESIEELVGLGFVAEVFSAPCAGSCVGECTEVVLELRIPA